VAFREWKKNKAWIWRALDARTRQTVAHHVGKRDDRSCKKFLDKVGIAGKTFLADDWPGFVRLIPEDQLFTGKDLTYPIEQSNSNIRHYLGRFRRRSKITSRAHHMVTKSLNLLHHLMQPQNFSVYQNQALCIFS